MSGLKKLLLIYRFNVITIQDSNYMLIFCFQSFLLLFYYICPNFSPFALLCPSHPHSHSQIPHYCPYPSFIDVLCLVYSLISIIILLPSTLWSLSICSVFPCLWFYFDNYFVHQILLIGQIIWYLSFTKNKQQVLARMQRKGNTSTLLVEIQTGEVTVENSIEFPQKTKKWNCLLTQ